MDMHSLWHDLLSVCAAIHILCVFFDADIASAAKAEASAEPGQYLACLTVRLLC